MPNLDIEEHGAYDLPLLIPLVLEAEEAGQLLGHLGLGFGVWGLGFGDCGVKPRERSGKQRTTRRNSQCETKQSCRVNGV